MRIEKTLILLIFSLNLFSQEADDKILACLKTNFDLVGFDYPKIMEEVEMDLIKNKIIDQSSESMRNQISLVSEIGIIENKRTYENIKLEQLGIVSIKHCVNLITYTLKDCEVPHVFSLFKDMDFLNQKIQQKQNFSLFEIRKETANILNSYSDQFSKQSALWKIIFLEYLYRISDFDQMDDLPELPPFGFKEIDVAKSLKLHVRSDGRLLIQDKVIEYEEICETIISTIKENQLINLTSEKGTKFEFYYKVYNSLNECIEDLRNEKAELLYGKNHDELNLMESENIDKIIPIGIIQNRPK